MQPIRTIWTILVIDHPRTIPDEFGQIPIGGSQKKSFDVFLMYFNVKLWPPGHDKFWPHRHNLNNFGRGPLDDVIYQIWKLWAL